MNAENTGTIEIMVERFIAASPLECFDAWLDPNIPGDDLNEAVALAQKSPGLKYGFNHEILPEISLVQAATDRRPD